MRRRNPHTGLVVFWVKLRQRGYTKFISGLYRLLQRIDGKPIKLPNPYAIERVQTDNSFAFTNRLSNSKKKPLTLFEKTLILLDIRHKLIKPYTPKHNGRAERSHRKDNEEFYATHTFFSFDDFKKQLWWQIKS